MNGHSNLVQSKIVKSNLKAAVNNLFVTNTLSLSWQLFVVHCLFYIQLRASVFSTAFICIPHITRWGRLIRLACIMQHLEHAVMSRDYIRHMQPTYITTNQSNPTATRACSTLNMLVKLVMIILIIIWIHKECEVNCIQELQLQTI